MKQTNPPTLKLRAAGSVLLALAACIDHAYSLGLVMCMGDSLTEGAGIGVRGGGFRVQIQSSVNSNGMSLLYVGTLTSTNGPLFPINPEHEGHGGWTTQDLVTGRNGEGNVASWLQQENPDRIVLLIGQNDPGEWEYLPALDKELLDMIFMTKPDVKLYWSNLIAVEPHDSYNFFHCQQADIAIRSLVPYYQLLGKSVTYMDAFSYMYDKPGIHDPSGVHLSDYGYDLLGAFYAQHIRRSLTSNSPTQAFPRG